MNTSVFFIRGYFPIGGFIYLIRYKGKNLILKCQKKRCGFIHKSVFFRYVIRLTEPFPVYILVYMKPVNRPHSALKKLCKKREP